MIYKKHLPRMGVTLLFFFFGGSSATWASRIPTIKLSMNVSDSNWGLVLLFLSIGTLITLPFAGNLIKKLGSKKSTLTFIILYFIFLIGIGFCGELWQLKLNLIAYGAIGNLTNIAINTQAVNVSKSYKGQIIGSMHGTWSIGGFFASWLGAVMIAKNIPPSEHFILYSSIGILVSLWLFRYLLPDESKEEPMELPKKSKFIRVDKNLIVLGFLAFFAMVSEGTMTDWSNEYMRNIVKADKKYIGYGLTAYMAAMACGRFISDFIVRKFGSKVTLIISGSLIFTGMICAVLFPTLLTTLLSFIIVGLGISAVVPLVYTLAGNSKTASPEQALTVITSIGFIGFFLGPPCIGFLAEKFSLQISFTFISLFGIGIIFLVRFFKIK